MEINRHLNLTPSPVSEPAATSRGTREAASTAVASTGKAGARPLEQLQDALRALPEVDSDKVETLRKVLREGSLDSSASALANGILIYHGVREA